MQAGQIWKYTCEDYPDTLISVIVDTATINSQLYYLYAPYGKGPSDNWPRYWLRPLFKKVYALNNLDSTEYLLFDFDAETGHNWEIPPVSAPPWYQPFNQCDWGSSISLVEYQTIFNSNRTFYNSYHFGHFGHPCSDAGITDTWFARDFGMVRFSQNTEGGVLDWDLVVDRPDTSLLYGIYRMVGNPCLTSPCLPGLVSAITANNLNYILTQQDDFFWNGNFFWGDYTPVENDSVLAKGIITKRKDYPGKEYYTLEVLEFKKIVSTGMADHLVGFTSTKDVVQQNYPNPFNPVTRIEYFMAKPGNVRIMLYDNIGREVKTIINEFKPAGYHSVIVDGRDFPSGIYYYRLITNNNIQTKAMVLTR